MFLIAFRYVFQYPVTILEIHLEGLRGDDACVARKNFAYI